MRWVLEAVARACRHVSERSQDQRVLMVMVGLDFSGRTKLLYRLCYGQDVNTIPTIGFNVEEAQSGDVRFTIWDVGGGCKIRELWRHYFTDMRCFLFVIDSTDIERMDEAKDILHRTVNAENFPAGMPVMIVANKQDLPAAIRAPQIAELLALYQLPRPWHIAETSALSGQGVDDVLNRLGAVLAATPVTQI